MSNYQEQSIGTVVRELEQDFISGTGTLMSKFVRTDLYTDINTIYAYLESKHVSGQFDSMGREKPFFNIVLASRNIWYRATDRDRKDIQLRAKKSTDIFGAFLLNVHLQNWMNQARFGVFLNNWGMELSGFNSAVSKFVEKDGELICTVVPWSRIICDQINFANNPKIEILELTESELYSRGYDKDAVEALAQSTADRQLTNRQTRDSKSNYYKVYEVHGVFPLSYITGNEEDEDTFVQQMHVLSFVNTQTDGRKKGDWEDFTLFKGKEAKDPYKLTSLLPSDDGSVSLNGSVKNLFDAQWMENHTKKAIKDQLDLASKLIFQTSDGNYVGQNALSAIETGDILIHAVNQPLTQLANTSHDITALQNFGAEWKQLSSELNGVSEAMLGVAPKAGTAWRQTEALLSESHSLFEIMGENKDLALEDMLREFILPFLLKKMDTSEEISATLDTYNIQKIDKQYVNSKGTKNFNEEIKKSILEKGIIPDITLEGEMAKVQEGLDALGNQRFFVPSDISNTTWKDLFKDLDVDIEVVNDESSNTQEIFTTLNTALQTVVNPNFANNPKAQFIVDKILTKTGHISPMELAAIPAPQPIQPTANPMAGQVEVGLPVNQA